MHPLQNRRFGQRPSLRIAYETFGALAEEYQKETKTVGELAFASWMRPVASGVS